MRQTSRREFLATTGALGLAAGTSKAVANEPTTPLSGRRPNVVLVMTDDQGYGDLACHGNPYLETPVLDRLHAESTRLEQFHVCPVCSPTRASLMTGRYNYRTGVIDTYLGRSMMHADELTMAEALRDAGYRTGIFGKWHLGDTYPLRAMDNGFEESLVHNGGGLGQPSDPPGNSYFHPVLKHNGESARHTGYCTDIFTDAAMDFIEAHQDDPFFVYLSTNAPHTPLDIGEEYVRGYRDKGLDDRLAKFYGMIANIDDNVGRLLAKLDALGLAENTLFVFMTDNGSSHVGGPTQFNAGQRGWKGTVYQGGVRVPCFLRWPGTLAARGIETMAAHIDLFPTLLDLCGAPQPEDRTIDGRSLVPLLAGASAAWEDRKLFFQWHRGDAPEPFRACAVRSQRYKLVNGKELYDLENDPGEKTNIAKAHPEVVQELRQAYEAWFADVSATRGYDPPRIQIGTPEENPVILTRQDWRGPEGWSDKHVGHWLVNAARGGTYDIRVDVPESALPGQVHIELAGQSHKADIALKTSHALFTGCRLEQGPHQVNACLETGGKRLGARYVTLDRVSE